MSKEQEKKPPLVAVKAGDVRYVARGERVLAHAGSTVHVLAGGYAKIKKGAMGYIYPDGTADVYGRAEVKNRGQAVVHKGGSAHVKRGGKALAFAGSKARAEANGTIYYLPKSKVTREKYGILIEFTGGEIDFPMRRRPPNRVRRKRPESGRLPKAA